MTQFSTFNFRWTNENWKTLVKAFQLGHKLIAFPSHEGTSRINSSYRKQSCIQNGFIQGIQPPFTLLKNLLPFSTENFSSEIFWPWNQDEIKEEDKKHVKVFYSRETRKVNETRKIFILMNFKQENRFCHGSKKKLLEKEMYSMFLHWRCWKNQHGYEFHFSMIRFLSKGIKPTSTSQLNFNS